MTELADTSAWTNRSKNAAVAREFNDLVTAGAIVTCEIVKLELLWSARDAVEFARLRRNLDSLELVPVDSAAWQRATDVFESLAAEAPLHHRRVKLPDLLVAAAAERADIPVCHYDGDFELIAALTGQAVRAIAPLGSL